MAGNSGCGLGPLTRVVAFLEMLTEYGMTTVSIAETIFKTSSFFNAHFWYFGLLKSSSCVTCAIASFVRRPLYD